MNKKKTAIALCDIVLYIIIFMVLQATCLLLFQLIFKEEQALAMVLGQALSAVLTIAVFAATRWARFGLRHFSAKPVTLLISIAIFAMGTLLPSEWILETSNIDMPDSYKGLFEMILSHPLGIFSIFFLVPISEEVVLRGAILRRLLDWLDSDNDNDDSKRSNTGHWIAIIISALIFALLHGNLAQGVHAFVAGLFLGWLFYKTRSILPGLVFHWVNNTASVVQSYIWGIEEDIRVIDMFAGNETLMYASLAISVVVAIIAFIKVLGIR